MIQINKDLPSFLHRAIVSELAEAVQEFILDSFHLEVTKDSYTWAFTSYYNEVVDNRTAAFNIAEKFLANESEWITEVLNIGKDIAFGFDPGLPGSVVGFYEI